MSTNGDGEVRSWCDTLSFPHKMPEFVFLCKIVFGPSQPVDVFIEELSNIIVKVQLLYSNP